MGDEEGPESRTENGVRWFHDWNHLTGGEERRERFAALAAEVDVLVVERSHLTERQKHRTEAAENELARGGDIEIVPADELHQRVEEGEATLPLEERVLRTVERVLPYESTARTGLVDDEGQVLETNNAEYEMLTAQWRALEDHPDPPRIDSEPTNDDVLTPLRQLAYQKSLQRGRRSDVDNRFVAAVNRLRDARVAAYVDRLVEEEGYDPEQIGVALGAAHEADRIVAGSHGIAPRSERSGTIPDDARGRTAVRNALRDTDGVGYALLGDPEEVAADLGAATAQARLAAVGAPLLADPSLPNEKLDMGSSTDLTPIDVAVPSIEGFPGDYADAVGTALDDADTLDETARVRRLQSVARKKLEEVVDLDAAERHGDLDPRPVAPDETVVDAVVDALPNDGDDRREGVERLVETGTLEPGRIDPRQIVGLQSVARGVDVRRVVQPLQYDAADAAADLAGEVDEVYRERRRLPSLRRGTRTALRTARAGAIGFLDAIGRLPSQLDRDATTPSDEEPSLPDGDASDRNEAAPATGQSVSTDDLGRELGHEGLGDMVADVVGSTETTPTVANALRRIGDGDDRLTERLDADTAEERTGERRNGQESRTQ